MVLGVCRGVLRDLHDAEDAFQAAFLIFARKAGSVRKAEALGSWLYGVAYRTALKARELLGRRRAKERNMARREAVVQPPWDEVRALLDQGRDASFDLGAVLSRYAGQLDGAGSTKVARLAKPKAKGTR